MYGISYATMCFILSLPPPLLSLSLSPPPSSFPLPLFPQRMARARTPEIRIQRETDSHISLSPSPRGSPASSRGGTPERSSPKHVKGTRAKFIRQNPRFINSPICQMDPGSGGKSVAECLDWREEGRSGATLRQAGHG